MTIKDELREQFVFLKRQPYEKKKEYKARIMARGQELFDRRNCTLEEYICFRALYNCRAKYFIINSKIILGDLTSEEYALRKGNANDYEKFVNLIFFEHLDEKKFLSEKAKLYDEFIKKQCSHPYYLFSDSYYYYDCEEDKLLEDEKLERFYEKETKVKYEGKVKVKGITLKRRVFRNKNR